ncbi:MAG: sensor histidine kinase [Bacteroidetes bacterium]|nr:MAG: sensor histidine kinase [Bacteroidota bacterium]RLD73580.1 MAG: sensor histidine kinase [Bacteroidota bacterium]
MINTSPKKIALINATVITLITAVFDILIAIIYDFFKPLPFILTLVVVFVVSFVIINYSLEKFIYQKIKIIYKTIGRLKPGKKEELKKRSKSADVLEMVNQVVLDWNEEKEKEIDELKQMAKYRREFVGNVSHELKTPVFNIQGYILTLLDGGIDDPEINIKFLKKAKKSVNRMIAIVDDLEEINKLESGELKLKKETFDLLELTREVMDFMEMKAEEFKAGINIKSHFRNIKVYADKRRIRQVLINLIDNAIKYGDEKHNQIDISFYDFHNNYLVEVSDNGIGIPEENLPRIFERFYRTDYSRSREKGGSGLGLAIVKHIIEAHRQTITVRSNYGKGTTFSFTLNKA